METIKKLSDLDPRDLSVVERVFGHSIEATADAVLILKTTETTASISELAGVPDWCDVLEGLSDEALNDFEATLDAPVRLARPVSEHGSKPL